MMLLALAAAGCGSAAQNSGELKVIAGENFWGSIAAQLGGNDVSVTSIVTNPSVDPHEYESSAADARAFATADYVILNGAGYDDWGQKLLAANPSSTRHVLVIADMLHKKAGDNPHFWYNPAWVVEAAKRISADYQAIRPAHAGLFTSRRDEFLLHTLAPYQEVIDQIRASDRGMPVGSTESIFVYMAQALGLSLTSPPEFMEAISEGDDPPAQSVGTFQRLIEQRQIKVLIVNTQTVTPITDNLKQLATRNGIPVVGISETVEPPTLSFQIWQVDQLTALKEALRRP